MRTAARILFVAAGLVMGVGPTSAHHSLNAVFDESQSVTLKGVVSKVEWVNPHVYLYLDVADEAGKVSAWSIETFPPGTLRRAGLTRDKLGYGQTITLTGYAARNGTQLAFLRTITFADGRELLISLGDIKTVR
ncbi:MAG TPA: DUF6152 family protein [Vicinamibacterales bacterium]|nr:DUF6152 family protein [Vicinamibacterales bacterium]